MNEGLLGIYLNDHLAGATFGLELARRIQTEDGDDPAAASALAEVSEQIDEDRETLKELMTRLGVAHDRVKGTAAWGAEKAARLKPNGKLIGHSPLSRLIELEMLSLGITGKKSLWRALETILGAEHAGVDFEDLIARAESQRRRVERMRLKAAAESLAEPS